jgi:hypothetical protein
MHRSAFQEPPKCNTTSLAAFQKVSASAFSAMWRGAKCNRTATLLRVFGLAKTGGTVRSYDERRRA